MEEQKLIHKKLWICPDCGRKFIRLHQSHSCNLYPIENHFKGNDKGLLLYKYFKQAVKEFVGPFKVESLECCIHFVNRKTFTAVRISKDKIRIEFTLNRRISNKRINKVIKFGSYRFLYFVTVSQPDEINKQLIGWIGEASK